MDVDIGGRDSLHGVGRTVIEQVGDRHGEIFLTNVEVGQSREHHSVIILLRTELILKAHNLEALATNLAPIDGALTHHIVNLFVRVGVIFDTRAHANDNTPRRIGGEDEHWVVNSTELRMDRGLHLVPLIQLNRVLSHGGTEGHGTITMQAVSLGHLRLSGGTIGRGEALDVLNRCAEPILDFLEDGEVRARRELRGHRDNSRGTQSCR